MPDQQRPVPVHGPSPLAEAYLELIQNSVLWSGSLDESFRFITRAVSAALAAQRVGVWSFADDGRRLTLLTAYDAADRSHHHGAELHRQRCAAYFAELETSRLIDIADAATDSRALDALPPVGSPGRAGAVLNAAIRPSGRNWGLLGIEHVGGPRQWQEAEKNFALAVADLLSEQVAYDEMRGNEERLRFIANNLPVGILQVDIEGNCTYANPGWCRLAGMDEASAAGRGWQAALHSEDCGAVLDDLRQVGQFDGVRESECRFVRSGGPLWLSCRWVAERDSSGFPIGALGSFTDISAQKQSLEQLRELGELQQTVLDGANRIIIATDADGVIRIFNRGAERLLGYSADEIVGRQTPLLFHDPAELGERARALSAETGTEMAPTFDALVAQVRANQPEEREWTFVRKDGSRFPASLSVSPLRDADGHVNGFIGIAADISDRRRMEALARREQTLVLQITNGIAAATGEQFFETLVEQLANTLEVDWTYIGELLPGPEPALHTVAVSGPELRRDSYIYQLEGTPCEELLRPDPQLLRLLSGARRRYPNSPWLVAHRVEAYLGMPLRAADGRVLGLLAVMNRAPLAETELSANLLRIFAVRAASELERRIQERAVLDSEHRYRALFDNAGDAIFVVEGERFVDCNPQTLAMFRGSREQVVGFSPYQLSPPQQPDGRPSREAALARIAVAMRGERCIFEWRHRRLDGSEFDAEVTLARVDLAGRPHLMATVRDVSERKRDERALAHSYERVRWLNQVSARLQGQRSVEEIAHASAAMLAEHSSAPMVAFYTYDAASKTIILLAEQGGGRKSDRRIGYRYEVEGDLARAEDLGVYADVVVDMAHMPEALAAIQARGVKSFAYLCLRADGEPVGLMTIDYTELTSLSEEERSDLLAFSRTVSLALDNARHLANIEFRAQHDSLTGLANRTVLHRELAERLAQRPSTLALMLLDLDRFKDINDTLGHHIGDKLLCLVGPRLEAALGPGYLLCRLGGDEFALLVPDASGDRPRELARRVAAALRQPFSVDGIALQVGVSIGIARYPQHGTDSHELLRSADVAMYAAKGAGGGLMVYDPAFDQHTPDRLALMAQLEAGVRGGELVLHYQPKIALSDHRAVGFEVLVRWQHPQQGLLAPAQFVPLAEMSELIHTLTMEVLRQALAQQQRWRRNGIRCAVAVNLSARNLLEEALPRQLQQLLKQFDADPLELELEITETSLMQEPDRAAHLLREIAALGVRLSIDDFGTGYSSLAYLRRLPIHALKIDRTFIEDMRVDEQDAIIVRSTITLAHNLGRQVVAEGVEDRVTLGLLEEMGCDLAQGFLIGRPLPPAAVVEWLNGGPHAP